MYTQPHSCLAIQTHLPDLFVDYHSDCSFGDIEHPSRLPLVELVRHAFMEGTVYLENKIGPPTVKL